MVSALPKPQDDKLVDVCDYCVNEAYDLGVEDYEGQANLMRSIGLEMPDHLCDYTETQGEIDCGCGCMAARKN